MDSVTDPGSPFLSGCECLFRASIRYVRCCICSTCSSMCCVPRVPEFVSCVPQFVPRVPKFVPGVPQFLRSIPRFVPHVPRFAPYVPQFVLSMLESRATARKPTWENERQHTSESQAIQCARSPREPKARKAPKTTRRRPVRQQRNHM